MSPVLSAAPSEGRVPSRPITGAVNAPSLQARDDIIRVRLTWLLVFRVVVVTVLLVTALVLKVSTEEVLFARAAVLLYAIAGLSYASILGGALWVWHFRNRGVVAVAYAQLFADAVIGTMLVALTGGVESIFVFLYSLAVLNAAIVLARRGAMVVASVSAAFYAIVLAAQAAQLVPMAGHAALEELVPSFLTNGASFFLVAVLGGYLTGQLTRTSERLEDAHAEIERLEQMYAAVLGSLPSGVMSVDDDGRVAYVNGAGGEILGARDLVGHPLGQRFGFLSELIGGAHDRFELEVAVAGRGARFIGGSVAPLIGIGRAGSVVVFQDLTELRRLQGDVARAERLAELGRLAAGLAHEVRNPLAAMIGCLQLLSADAPKLDEEGGRMLGIVQREAERLSRLVEEFLTYARPSAPRSEGVAARALLEDLTHTARQGLKAVSVDIVKQGGVDVVARCDPAQLRQVLWNLLVNADAVVALAGREGKVELSAQREGDEVVFHVDDDGPGVPEELRDRVFEPFFTTRPNGNGLGLATCQQLIRQNQGRIGVATSPLGGARFSVHLALDRSPIAT
ncbi:MAG: ATP-binding protein [Deltaproteobacteria bacterium]|nr:ATP-binding protein [Deltaproteobacteria bacterium]